LFFDGVCGLCNKAVDFSVNHLASENLLFAPLQGETAQKLLEPYYSQAMNSLVLYTPDGVLTRSDAALELCRHFSKPWKWLIVFKVIPRPFRNWVYDFVAKNRYRIFGKKESCRLPSLAEKALFLP